MSENTVKQAGIACPECGGAKWRTLRTEQRPGRISRRKKCQNCGHRSTTVERIVNEQAPDADETATCIGLRIGHFLQTQNLLQMTDSQPG